MQTHKGAAGGPEVPITLPMAIKKTTRGCTESVAQLSMTTTGGHHSKSGSMSFHTADGQVAASCWLMCFCHASSMQSLFWFVLYNSVCSIQTYGKVTEHCGNVQLNIGCLYTMHCHELLSLHAVPVGCSLPHA